jgi:hypothetical protein
VFGIEVHEGRRQEQRGARFEVYRESTLRVRAGFAVFLDAPHGAISAHVCRRKGDHWVSQSVVVESLAGGEDPRKRATNTTRKAANTVMVRASMIVLMTGYATLNTAKVPPAASAAVRPM